MNKTINKPTLILNKILKILVIKYFASKYEGVNKNRLALWKVCFDKGLLIVMPSLVNWIIIVNNRKYKHDS